MPFRVIVSQNSTTENKVDSLKAAQNLVIVNTVGYATGIQCCQLRVLNNWFVCLFVFFATGYIYSGNARITTEIKCFS